MEVLSYKRRVDNLFLEVFSMDELGEYVAI